MKLAVVAAFVCAHALALAPPTYNPQYTMEGVISMPYDNIVEPFKYFFNGITGQQRVEYYGGLDVYITDVSQNSMWQVNPQGMDGHDVCVVTTGQQAVTSIIPDVSSYKHMGKTTIDGHMVNQWQLVNKVGAKVNTYNFYADAVSGAPVQYSWVGFDALLGSHYDQYIIDYHQFLPGVGGFNVSTFVKPDMDCGGFPGPGFSNPGLQISALFPDGNNGYAEYNAHHNRTHDAAREIDFVRNARFVHMFNRKMAHVERSSLRLAVNFLADASDVEMAARAGKGPKKRGVTPSLGASVTQLPPASLEALPTNLNWTAKGAVTPVKDQGICGSCWSFGTAETIEGAHFLKHGVLANLSQQSLMDCSWDMGNNACDGGESWRAYEWMMKDNGGRIPTADSYGQYLMADGRCHVRDSSVQTGATITGFGNVTVGSETAMVAALAAHGPLSIAIDASLKSFSFYSSGNYFDPACKSDADSLDHQVLAVGYGVDANGEEYFLVKNSWSTHWGDNGYVRFARGLKAHPNVCGVASDATWTIVE